MNDSFPSNDEYFKNKPKDLCPICNKEILYSQMKVPRMNNNMEREFVHRECENSTNDYMKWDESGEPHLTFKGQFFNWIKMWVILITIINEKIHGRNIFDDEQTYSREVKE